MNFTKYRKQLTVSGAIWALLLGSFMILRFGPVEGDGLGGFVSLVLLTIPMLICASGFAFFLGRSLMHQTTKSVRRIIIVVLIFLVIQLSLKITWGITVISFIEQFIY